MPPHAPCRLQRGKEKCNEISASLPPHAPCRLQRFINSTDEIEVHLCLHTLRADCNGKEYRKPASHNLCLHTLRADCNLILRTNFLLTILCLHTLRADCNMNLLMLSALKPALPPHAPCRLQLQSKRTRHFASTFASTRSVQIATAIWACITKSTSFASTRSVQIATPSQRVILCKKIFASTRSVQIATAMFEKAKREGKLCLHTLRADCNRLAPTLGVNWWLCLHTLRADCNHVFMRGWLRSQPLPPHAPCRLQPARGATRGIQRISLPPHAPCRLQLKATRQSTSRRTLPPHAPCRLQQ